MRSLSNCASRLKKMASSNANWSRASCSISNCLHSKGSTRCNLNRQAQLWCLPQSQQLQICSQCLPLLGLFRLKPLHCQPPWIWNSSNTSNKRKSNISWVLWRLSTRTQAAWQVLHSLLVFHRPLRFRKQALCRQPRQRVMPILHSSSLFLTRAFSAKKLVPNHLPVYSPRTLKSRFRLIRVKWSFQSLSEELGEAVTG